MRKLGEYVRSTSYQSSKPCTVLQYPSRETLVLFLGYTHTHTIEDHYRSGKFQKVIVGLVNCVYGVATIGRLLKMIGLFCKRAL